MAPFSFQTPLRAAALSKKRLKSEAKHRSNGLKDMKDMKRSVKRLRTEMKEISEEHKDIREGQRLVKQKFEANAAACEELRRHTTLIMQQSARTQVKLAIMFRILKAREACDFNPLPT